MKRGYKTLIIAITSAIFILIIIIALRAILPREFDDLSPEIRCNQDLIEKSQILWIIPLYNNHSIANDSEWCSKIKSLNKTLGMHGVYHNYKEFNSDKDIEYIKQGINAFEKCFNLKPNLFKAPQLALSNNNGVLLKSLDFSLKENFNQMLRKVYHCSDTGKFSNKFIDWI